MNTDIIFREADDAYESGDFSKAYALFLEAAGHGDCHAMTRLAAMYESGDGVPRDLTKSIEWDLKAVAAGSTTSILNLGVTFRKIGNVDEAQRWFEKAMANDDGEAALELAKLHYSVNSESPLVRKYLDIAAARFKPRSNDVMQGLGAKHGLGQSCPHTGDRGSVSCSDFMGITWGKSFTALQRISWRFRKFHAVISKIQTLFYLDHLAYRGCSVPGFEGSWKTSLAPSRSAIHMNAADQRAGQDRPTDAQPAARCCWSTRKLQVFALVLIAGGRSVAGGEGEAVHANSDVLRRATNRRTYASGKNQMKMIAAENRVDVFRRIAKAMLKRASQCPSRFLPPSILCEACKYANGAVCGK
eukprot:gene22955-27518_t